MLNRLTLFLGLSITALAVAVAALAPPIFSQARDLVFDGYQRAAPRAYDPEAPVHIIDIDEAALDAYGQWPWPRSYMAALTDRLFDHGAVAVGFDVLFAEPDRTSPERITESWSRFRDTIPPVLPDLGLPRHDQVFANAIDSRPIVLSVAGGAEGEVPVPRAGIAVTGTLPPSLTQYPAAVVNLPELTEVAAGIGTITLGRTGDGVTRTVPLVSQVGDVLMPALSVELLRVAQAAGGHILRTTEGSGEISGGTVAAIAMRTGALTFPVEADGAFRIHYAGHQPGRITPVAQVLEADGIDPELEARISGRIILVGSSAQGLFDIRTTPLNPAISGVTLHAEIIEQIVDGTFLTRPDWMPGLELVIVVLTGVVLTGLQLLQRPVLGLAAALILTSAPGIAGIMAFQQAGLLFDPVLPTLTALAVFLPGTTLGFLSKERARRSIRARFAYFLPPALIGQIEANPEAALTPEGAERELSVMFVDMRGFSTVTEGMPPDRVVQLVNTFLSAVAETLVDRGATIDKFIGDAVMAFWNAPFAQDDHATKALRAISDVETAAAEASKALEAEGYPPIRVAIGLNTGKAYVGLMGSRDRLSYTCVGDAVTLAARLEGLTRSYGVSNCVGPAAAAASPPGLRAVVVDRIAAKGFEQAVDVSVMIAPSDQGAADFAEILSAARSAYLGRDWDRAEAEFTRLAALDLSFCDTAQLAQTYLDRIAAHRNSPPSATWDGSAIALSKR